MPEPFAPLVTVSQLLLLLTAVQVQPDSADTDTVPVVPPAGAEADATPVM